MTSEKRIIADLKDILAIRLTCKKCHASVLIPPSEQFNIHDRCSNCPEQLFLRDDVGKKQLEMFIGALANLAKRGKDSPCHIQLELEQPE